MYNNLDQDPAHQRRLFLAVALSTLIMGLWYYFYQMPLQQQQMQQRAKIRAEQQLKLQEQAKNIDVSEIVTNVVTGKIEAAPSQAEILKNSPRIKINNGKIHGAIRLIGARLDDVTLANYHEKLSKTSPEVALMNPSGSSNKTQTNFIDIGWLAADPAIKTPTPESLWKNENANIELTQNAPVELSWDNGQGQKFFVTYAIDENYMFKISQRVENKSATAVKLFPFGLLNKAERTEHKDLILHTGPLGVMDGTITEVSYKNLRENPEQVFENSTGWIGITDKYWFKSLIPQNGESYKATFRRSENNGLERFQVDYLGKEKIVQPNSSITYDLMVFTGAKELKLLEKYAADYKLPLFERAIDFGWFHFITKPMYYALIKFYSWLGNFGLAIILLTFCVKILLFPLARKSYISMGKLKILQPKVADLQKRYKDDKMGMQKALMAMYKKEKVNPAAGCLPILLQIPIFFSLYKVFFVSIEMRHAPFFGWIKDLSERDPTSIFNLFGALPFDVPSYLLIGFYPCLMAVTMYIQQILQPAPTDAMTAKMMRMMPLLFLFMFASFPSGLVLYWCCSNILTICQQLYFLRRHPRK